MSKIFTSEQIHKLDAYTIANEPISSIKLMERAAVAMTQAVMDRWGKETPIVVFAGPGNNGGDALAMARLLSEKQYNVVAYLFNVKGNLSADCRANSERLHESKYLKRFVEVRQEFDPPELTAETVVIDGLFGSGLNKPLGGGFASLVKYVNASEAQVVSIDLPSGLMAEDNTYNTQSNIIRADLTLTLQMKKMCMYMADCQQYLGEVKVLDIRLSQQWMDAEDTPYHLLERKHVKAVLHPRSEYAHKGSMGHALLVSGCHGMAGAAQLAARACLRSGVGKVTVHTPYCNNQILQIAVPEAIVDADKDEFCFSESVDTTTYNAVAIGPGIGQRETTAVALIAQIRRSQHLPMVLDADALNLLGARQAWMQQLPQGVVLTPHPREFDRLDGTTSSSDYERLQKARDMAQRLQVLILLKGHHTALCCPDGKVLFNTTGNGGMATAGSGDVLTGIIVSLMARGYKPVDAAILGMYLHGLAGDFAARQLGEESLIASDIISYLPQAFQELQK